MNGKLYSRSIELILENQSAWGSYVASPAFPTYHYSWLRDGSYIAHSMDCVGVHNSAASFFRWVGNTIQRYSHKVDSVERALRQGTAIDRDMILHTRFTLDGHEGTTDNTWGDFQIDGYGTWLWALASHVRATGDRGLLEELGPAVHTTIRYLALTWKLPNYDCWEEHPEYLHPYSLACTYGGLNEILGLIQEAEVSDSQASLPPFQIDLASTLCEIREYLLRYGVIDGRVVKHILPQDREEPAGLPDQNAVDASLLGLGYPFKVLDPHDPVMAATVESIEAELHRPGGGVYRYRKDVYYGGGEWILLTAWLGIHSVLLGREEEAMRMLAWIEDQADAEGYLPEQSSDHLLAPAYFDAWVNKWGPVASPLLWSHAMYLILYSQLQERIHHER